MALGVSDVGMSGESRVQFVRQWAKARETIDMKKKMKACNLGRALQTSFQTENEGIKVFLPVMAWEGSTLNARSLRLRLTLAGYWKSKSLDWCCILSSKRRRPHGP